MEREELYKSICELFGEEKTVDRITPEIPTI